MPEVPTMVPRPRQPGTIVLPVGPNCSVADRPPKVGLYVPSGVELKPTK